MTFLQENENFYNELRTQVVYLLHSEGLKSFLSAECELVNKRRKITKSIVIDC